VIYFPKCLNFGPRQGYDPNVTLISLKFKPNFLVKIFFLLNASFVLAILDLISWVHLALILAVYWLTLFSVRMLREASGRHRRLFMIAKRTLDCRGIKIPVLQFRASRFSLSISLSAHGSCNFKSHLREKWLILTPQRTWQWRNAFDSTYIQDLTVKMPNCYEDV